MVERIPIQPPRHDGPSEALVRACNQANEYLRTTVFPAIRQAEQQLRTTCEEIQAKIDAGIPVDALDSNTVKGAIISAETAIGNSYSGNYQNKIVKILAELRIHKTYHQLRQDEPLSGDGPTSFLIALRESHHGDPKKPQYKFAPINTEQLLLQPAELSQRVHDICRTVSERIFMHQKKSEASGVTLMTAGLLNNAQEKVLLVRQIRDISAEAFDELLRNAFDATPRGGAITTSIEKQGDEAVITVSDTGKGITPEDLPHIFIERFTTKAAGTGRGLGLAKEYFEDILGGKVDVKSTVDVGTMVTIRLPLAKNA